MSRGFSATYGSMAHSVVELTVVLENLAPGGRRGKSCARPRAASRVMARELLVQSPSVLLLEGQADKWSEDVQRRAWRCPVVPGSHSAGDDATVPGMVAQWWGWPHRAGSDGGYALLWLDVTAPSGEGAG
jgi:hypothetical protein